jgi:acetyltransferase-like isoleucine patch superfamily enzyme
LILSLITLAKSAILYLSRQVKKRQRQSDPRLRLAKTAVMDLNVNVHCDEEGSIVIGEHSFINMFCTLNAIRSTITIGNDVLIGPYVILHTTHHQFDRLDQPIRAQGYYGAPITIEDDVYIGANCTILGGVRIGAHSVIGAHSLVNQDIPPYSVAYGVPCHVHRSRKSGEHDPLPDV